MIPTIGWQSLGSDHLFFPVCQQKLHLKALCRRVRKTKPSAVLADQTKFPDPIRNPVRLEPCRKRKIRPQLLGQRHREIPVHCTAEREDLAGTLRLPLNPRIPRTFRIDIQYRIRRRHSKCRQQQTDPEHSFSIPLNHVFNPFLLLIDLFFTWILHLPEPTAQIDSANRNSIYANAFRIAIPFPLMRGYILRCLSVSHHAESRMHPYADPVIRKRTPVGKQSIAAPGMMKPERGIRIGKSRLRRTP